MKFNNITQGRKTLVLDLDETLVHSGFTTAPNTDFIFTLRFLLEYAVYSLLIFYRGISYSIYVKIRPGAMEFIKEMSKYYELFLFTASVSDYANPVIDRIDPDHHIAVRLYRDNCSLV